MLLDVSMPDQSGVDALLAIQNRACPLRVLMLSGFPEEHYATTLLRQGASGYLGKDAEPEEILKAIRTIAMGRKYITTSMAERLASGLKNPDGQAAHEQLSERELQTLLKIASGKRLSDIAEELMLSPKTVSVYRARLLEKLKLSNNAELAVYAIRNELV